jgi:hypothetical protein
LSIVSGLKNHGPFYFCLSPISVGFEVVPRPPSAVLIPSGLHPLIRLEWRPPNEDRFLCH